MVGGAGRVAADRAGGYMGIWHCPMPVPAPLELQMSPPVHVPQVKPQPLSPQGFVRPHFAVQPSHTTCSSTNWQPLTAQAFTTAPWVPQESCQHTESPLPGSMGGRLGNAGQEAAGGPSQQPTFALAKHALQVPLAWQVCPPGQVPQLTPQPASPHTFPAQDAGVQQLPL